MSVKIRFVCYNCAAFVGRQYQAPILNVTEGKSPRIISATCSNCGKRMTREKK